MATTAPPAVSNKTVPGILTNSQLDSAELRIGLTQLGEEEDQLPECRILPANLLRYRPCLMTSQDRYVKSVDSSLSEVIPLMCSDGCKTPVADSEDLRWASARTPKAERPLTRGSCIRVRSRPDVRWWCRARRTEYQPHQHPQGRRGFGRSGKGFVRCLIVRKCRKNFLNALRR
jgi:hypothetical protein